jgi:cation diffusion facilitator CzcD-associated flavoprotein CzcO
MEPGSSPVAAGPAAGGQTFDHGWAASREGSRALKMRRREVAGGLGRLEARVAEDLRCLNLPPANWVPPRSLADGTPVLDVLVVGGGMCGQTAAFALMREGVTNLRVVDRAARGNEGPWGTFARMETLRSPKHLTSPDLGIPSLTFRAWYEARFGAEGWAALYKVWRTDWLDYLLWVRRMTGVRVENGIALEALGEGPEGLVLSTLRTEGGLQPVVARKVVLALGRDGSGAPRWPDFPSFDPASPQARERVFHSSDPIDFDALRGMRVGVLGAGASAFDNAGAALESGAAQVEMFARRAQLPQVNKSKWTSFPGFFHGFQSLPDPDRWRIYTYILSEQVPPPFESVLRCDRHPAYRLRLGEPWLDVVAASDGAIVRTESGRHRFDALIIATGFDVDLPERAELAGLRDSIVRWGDRVGQAEAERHPEAARFPYLGEGFALRSRHEERAQTLGRIHLFNWGATVSQGALASDIPGLGVGASRLAACISRDLFVENLRPLESALHALTEPELVATRWFVPAAPRD